LRLSNRSRSSSKYEKYSAAMQAEAEVQLQMAGHELELTVRDHGRGFNLADLRCDEGLGVRSMEERARLSGGRFEIYSQRGRGTTVSASVPIKPPARSATT
jgi:signal transduction histidine kinase